MATSARRILIIGGGQVGLFVALGLARRLRRSPADVVLVNPESFMVYQSFLPEAASGSIEPRHVVVPLRTVLKRTRLVIGEVTGLDHQRRVATVQPSVGSPYELPYDQVVLALGSVSRVLPIPGLQDHAVGFKTVTEAIYLRNQLLSRMDAADSAGDSALRARALTFVFVGGGYAGVEAMAELEDLARFACRYYPGVRREDMRWVLVEAAPRILPEIGEGLGEYALERLRRRDIEVFLSTTLQSAEGGVVTLSSGERFAADTLVWTAGVRPAPAAAHMGLPVDERGRIDVDEILRVRGTEGAWAAGDCAAVPDIVSGGLAPPRAQHALRQAKRLARNVAAAARGRPLIAYRHRSLGGLASLGLYKGVARVLGIRLRGFPAWFLHRSYHVVRVPTANRKARILADWTVALFFRRDVVQLGSLRTPRAPIEEAFEANRPARGKRES